MAWQSSTQHSLARSLPRSGGGVPTPSHAAGNRLGLAVRLVCGGLLIAAALLKGQAGAAQTAAGVVGGWPMFLLVQAELVLGSALLFGVWPRITRLIAAAFFGCGSLISAYKGLAGEATCGCFGALALSPWVTMVIDTCAALGLVRLWRPSAAATPGTLKLAAFAGLLAALTVPLALKAWQSPFYLDDAESTLAPGQLVVLEPQRWVGRRFPLLKYIDRGGELAHGVWTVVLYHDRCSKCRKRIEAERRRAGTAARLATIEMPPYGTSRPPAGAVYGRLSDGQEWFAVAPLVVRLREGMVWSAADGTAD